MGRNERFGSWWWFYLDVESRLGPALRPRVERCGLRGRDRWEEGVRGREEQGRRPLGRRRRTASPSAVAAGSAPGSRLPPAWFLGTAQIEHLGIPRGCRGPCPRSRPSARGSGSSAPRGAQAGALWARRRDLAAAPPSLRARPPRAGPPGSRRRRRRAPRRSVRSPQPQNGAGATGA
ncbi:unnamed protein product [Rangifer tarandus platyrhynchus]|uniref:Uncharacterized protein n=1 Tax=Rangifer tarandus platyrhynchus TaxID=3082113 RepID=A0ABN8ZUT5_RANTA|nr:unnamed protein product [Rangifer tarandus platyrhynchus]